MSYNWDGLSYVAQDELFVLLNEAETVADLKKLLRILIDALPKDPGY